MPKSTDNELYEVFVLLEDTGIECVPIGVALTEEDAEKMLNVKYDQADFYVRVPVAFP